MTLRLRGTSLLLIILLVFCVRGTWVAILLFLVLNCISGCSGSRPPSDVSAPPSYVASRNGVLHFQLPAGWFDATEDFKSSTAVVWLMRNDYSGSIIINEVTLDAAARHVVRNDGLLRLAQLTVSLSSENGGATVLQPPDIVVVNGRRLCAYEVLTASKDVVRVMLLDTGAHVYEVRALAEGKQRNASTVEVFSAQQNFVKSLRW